MEKIVIIAHGSPKKEANNLAYIANKLSSILGKNTDDVKVAYLKYGKPSAQEAILDYIKEGVKKIIVHPFFLSTGSHVSFDIPKMIDDFQKQYPEVKIICTKPLGSSDKLALIIRDLIEECGD